MGNTAITLQAYLNSDCLKYCVRPKLLGTEPTWCL